MAVILQSVNTTRRIRHLVDEIWSRRQALLGLHRRLQTKQPHPAQATCSGNQPREGKANLALPELQPSPLLCPLQSPHPPTTITTTDRTVRICQLSEYKAVALSLAHAFAEDPCALFFINTPDTAHCSPRQKWSLHLEIMEYMVYAHMLSGLVTTAGADYGAVALWMPPGKHMDSYATTLRSGIWRLQYRLSGVGRERWFRDFMPLLHDTKREVLGERDEEAWYLVYLGTRPEARRRGLARALVEDGIGMADEQGVPMYLESSKAMNVPIYEKFGFSIKTRVEIGARLGDKERVPLDIMVREPLACKVE